MIIKKRISIVSSIFSIYFIFIILVLFLQMNNIVTPKIVSSFGIAWSLNFTNYCIALALFRFSVQKSNKLFLIYNFGGMVTRMIFMLTCLILCIKSLKIDIYAFIFTFLVFYFMSLIGEIMYFHKKQTMISTAK